MLANQPKNDTLYIKGFNIVVENRAFTYRQVAQNVGQKACLMPAHYGYLQNNPKVGVFVGAFPESDTVYLINQKAQGGYFDKHIAMFGFLSEQQAVDTYQKCFEYGYIGLMSVVPCTIEQLKWWLANGDKSRPVTKERLPYAGLERLDSVLWGGEDKADLASHSGQVAKLLYQIRQSDSFNHALEPLSYHDLTQELGNQGFVYENYDALVIEYNKLERKAKQMLMAMQGAADIVKPVGVAVSKPLTKGGVANVVAWFEMDDGQAVGVFFHNPDKTPKKIDPTDEMISYKWVLNKQDITIVVAPENGKDLVVRTVAKRIMKLVDANHDRFLKANSDKAELNLKEQKLNAQVIDKQAELDALNKAIELLEAENAQSQERIAGILAENAAIQKEIDAVVQHKDKPNGIPTNEVEALLKIGRKWEKGGHSRIYFDVNMPAAIGLSISRYKTGNISSAVWADGEKISNTKATDLIDGLMVYFDINKGEFVKGNRTSEEHADLIIEKIKSQAGILAENESLQKEIDALEAQKAEKENAIKENQEVSTPVTLTGKELENPTLPQERPSNWLTNLANARAVAKSLGIETKGKKLERLVKDIGTNDENEVKKELLAEFKALASRLVLPKGYVFDLSNAEKAIDNVWHSSVSPMIKKQGETDTNSIRIELRTIPAFNEYQGDTRISDYVFFYTDDKKTKAELDKLNYQFFGDIGASGPTTPKTIVEKMEQFLTKAVFPKIEYLKVANSTNVDASKLSEIGIAEITDIGDESLYFEKDGKYYVSKVGNTQNYALGEWDFAKYPDGVVSQATEPKQPESEPPTVANGKIYDYLKEMGKPDGKVEFDDDYMVLLSIATRDINLPMEEFIDDEYDLEKISKRLTPHKEPLFKEAMANFKAKVNAEKVAAQNHDRDLLGFATMAALSTQTKQERDKKKSPDFVANTLAEKWTKALNGDSKAIKDIRDYFVSNKRVPNMTKAHLIILEGLTGQDFNSKTYEYVVQKFDDYINTITQSQEPVATNPDRDYLQSIIDGKADPLTIDFDALIALAEKYDGDEQMNPLIDVALEVINQAQQAESKGT